MDRNQEQRLVKKAAAGDRAAAEGLIKAHQGSLYMYLLRMSGRPEVAEDVAQEAFVRVLLNLDKFDPRFRFSTWLFTIAKRLYINSSQRLRPTCDSEAVGRSRSEHASPAAEAARNEGMADARDALGRALLELPEVQREIVLLFHQQGWSIAAVAVHMDMPEGTVKSHLHRGRHRLRAILEMSDKAVTSGSWSSWGALA